MGGGLESRCVCRVYGADGDQFVSERGRLPGRANL